MDTPIFDGLWLEYAELVGEMQERVANSSHNLADLNSLEIADHYDPECVDCQGTGMATLNPDEEPGSHSCRRGGK